MHYPVRSATRPLFYSVLIALLLFAVTLLYSAQTVATKSLSTGHIGADGGHAPIYRVYGKQAPTRADCLATGYPCYTPQDLQTAYDVNPLLSKGFTGKGQTIVIIDSYGSPTALADLKHFDADYGLPDPPSFQQLSPLGSVPFDPTNSDQQGWAVETSLDVQWAHSMAPGASIVVLTSPVSETEGVQGLPQFLQLEQYAVDHHLGKIISQSWSATENTLFSPAGEQQVLEPFNSFYERAALESHVSIFASTGDSGSSNPDVNGNIYHEPTVGFPASSPWVTAVGGTSLYTDAQGNYQSESVWNESALGGGAGGGGISQYYSEPLYQKLLPASDQKLLNGHRGIPDISMVGDPYTGVPLYLGFPGIPSGYYIYGGTSLSSPLWAGLTAVANQYAGHPLGFLNPKLYLLGSNSHVSKYFLHDITTGNNAYNGIPGYNATPGWDAASGLGSPIAAQLVQALKYTP